MRKIKACDPIRNAYSLRMSNTNQIAAARKTVNSLTFGTPEWEAAMQIVRNLVNAEMEAAPKERFCSVDSGWHATRLSDGRIINA
jgi:hypothetical protein